MLTILVPCTNRYSSKSTYSCFKANILHCYYAVTLFTLFFGNSDHVKAPVVLYVASDYRMELLKYSHMFLTRKPHASLYIIICFILNIVKLWL